MTKTHITHTLLYSLLTMANISLSMDVEQKPQQNEPSALPQATFYYQSQDNSYANISDFLAPAKTFSPQEKHGHCWFYSNGKDSFIQQTDRTRTIALGKPISIQKPRPEILSVISQDGSLKKTVVQVGAKNLLLLSTQREIKDTPVIMHKKINQIGSVFYQLDENYYQLLPKNQTGFFSMDVSTQSAATSGILAGYFNGRCLINMLDEKNSITETIALPMDPEVYKSAKDRNDQGNQLFIEYQSKNNESEQPNKTVINIVKQPTAPSTKDQPERTLTQISHNPYSVEKQKPESTTIYEAKATKVYDHINREVIKITFNVAGTQFTRFVTDSYWERELYVKINDISEDAYVHFTRPSNELQKISAIDLILKASTKKNILPTECANQFEQQIKQQLGCKTDTINTASYTLHKDMPAGTFLPVYKGTIINNPGNYDYRLTITENNENVRITLKDTISHPDHGLLSSTCYIALKDKNCADVFIVECSPAEQKDDSQDRARTSNQSFPILSSLRRIIYKHYIAAGAIGIGAVVSFFYYLTHK